jgi:hypothetical protein
MFQENIDLRKFFKFGDYKESSDLLQNKIFLNHVTLVMHTFDEAICSMGDTDYVMEMLRGIGKSHRRLPEFNFMIFSVGLLKRVLSCENKYLKPMNKAKVRAAIWPL